MIILLIAALQTNGGANDEREIERVVEVPHVRWLVLVQGVVGDFLVAVIVEANQQFLLQFVIMGRQVLCKQLCG